MAYTGTLTHVSDSKFKKSVADLPSGLSLIQQLRPRTFSYNTTNYPFMNFSTGPQMGFLAQEVFAVAPQLVSNACFPPLYDSVGHLLRDTIQYKSVNDIGLIPILVKSIQELKSKNDSLKLGLTKTIDSLKHVIINYDNRFTNLEQMINACCKANGRGMENTTGDNTTPNNYQMVELTSETTIILDQNSPNPFKEETDISYFLPETVNNAKIMFYDNNGIIIKAVELNGKGKGNLHVYASNLSAGLYTYALIVDGKLIDSKKMVCTKK